MIFCYNLDNNGGEVMYVLGICDAGEILETFSIVNTIVLIIKIVVPITLLVSGMITLLKAIKDKDENLLSMAKKSLITKCIAAIFIFFVPTFVNFLVKAGSTEENNYIDCLNNATPENISKAYLTEAETLLARADENKDLDDYYAARVAASKIKDKELRKKYMEKLDAMYEIIKKEMEEAEKNTNPGGGNNGGGNNGGGNNGGGNNTGSSFPYYAQCDSKWGNKSYNGTNLCHAGCGYTSLAMVLSGLKNDSSITPYTVHEYVYGQGISVNPGGGAITDAALVSPKVASKYGVTIQTLFGRNYNEDSATHQKEASLITNALDQGKLVVLLIPGHYIALGGNGTNVVVHDPANSSNNGTYTIEQVYNKFKNYSNRCSSGGTCGFIYAVAYS